MATADYTPSIPHPPTSTLPIALQRIATRRHTLVMIREIARALTWGLGLAAVMILAFRFYLVDGPSWIPVSPIVAAIIIGWRNGVLRRDTLLNTAIAADEKLGWKEQLSSAFAFSQTNASATATALVPALIADAAARSQTLDPKTLYPFRLERTHRIFLLTLALLLVVLFMPNVPWLLSDTEQNQRRIVTNQGNELVAVAKEIEKVENKQDDPTNATRQLAKRLEALGHKMMRGRMNKKEALTSLGTLKKELENATSNQPSEQNPNSNLENLKKALQQLADQPQESQSGRQIQEALRNNDADSAAQEMEQLAKKMEKGNLSPEEKQKAANDLKQMAKALQKQGGENNKQLSQQLEQAAKALQQQAQKKSGQQSGQQQNQNGQSQQGKGQNSNTQGQQGNSDASKALQQMAKSLRQSGGNSNSQSLQKMLDKIKEAERETGTNGGSQSGSQNGKGQSGKNNSTGNNNCPGGNCGNGMEPGKDLKATDPHSPVGGGAGLGPRNNAQGSKSGGGVSKDKMKRTGDKRRWEDVWSDRLPATHKKIDRVQGKYSGDGEMEQLPTKTEGQGGGAKTPYYEVYESYKKDAEDAVNKEAVPPAYKQPVKDYFESIKPH